MHAFQINVHLVSHSFANLSQESLFRGLIELAGWYKNDLNGLGRILKDLCFENFSLLFKDVI